MFPLTVVPRGTTKLVVRFETLARHSSKMRDGGSVAVDDLVEKAFEEGRGAARPTKWRI